MSVYITDIAAFLPNAPVANDQIEQVLGMSGAAASRTRRIILRSNKIKTRHYAVDPANGEFTHTNAQLTAEAVRGLAPAEDFNVSDIELLACGTSSPDQNMPGHASMVHGELGAAPCEVVSTMGICMAGMAALKYAWLSVAQKQTANAVATGSELASSYLRAPFCGPPTDERVDALERDNALAFDAEFLRWMLSDGAGAAYLTATPPEEAGRTALKIEWIESVSFANELDTCMYAGGEITEDGRMIGWRQIASKHNPSSQETHRALMIKQDIKLLEKEIIATAVDRTLPRVLGKHSLDPKGVDYLLPHYSSNHFRKPFHDALEKIGFGLPYEKWFTNLQSKGNTGAASIYIMLEELFHSGRLVPGEKILAFVPESGRFSISYMLLTVV